jgi:uncharacterized membrane protein
MSNIGPSDRANDLSQVPSSMTGGARPQTAEERAQQQQEQPQPQPSPSQGYSQQQPPPAATPGFDGNQPTIISLLYISSIVFGLTGLVAMILAYVWKDKPQAEWEVSHYQYHIRTFWIWLVEVVIGVITSFILIGIFILIAAWIHVLVRGIMSLIKAQAREPMPNPETLLA